MEAKRGSECLLKSVSNIDFNPKLGKDGNVTTEVLLKICRALDCDMSDIMEIVKD